MAKRSALNDLTNAIGNVGSDEVKRALPKKRQKRSASSTSTSSCSTVALGTPGGAITEEKELIDFDSKDQNNPQMCVTYVNDIIRHYRAKERADVSRFRWFARSVP